MEWVRAEAVDANDHTVYSWAGVYCTKGSELRNHRLKAYSL